jgi:hypothetical protein
MIGRRSSAIAVACLGHALACGPKAPADRFLADPVADPGAILSIVGETRALRLPPDMHFAAEPALPAGVLAKARSERGPTIVIARVVDGLPAGQTARGCAEVVRARIALATARADVVSTTPRISEEDRGGERWPRLDYAVALEARAGERAASALASELFFIGAGGRCVGVSITDPVRARAGQPDEPDPDEIARHQRVVDAVFDGLAAPRR